MTYDVDPVFFEALKPQYSFLVEERVLEISEKRNLSCRVYVSQCPQGSCPIIVFSHGVGASLDSYRVWGESWAGQGYHSLHCLNPDMDRQAFTHVQSQNPTWDTGLIVSTLASQPHLVDRVAEDLRQIPAAFEKTLAKTPKPFAGPVGEWGVAGHSFGAYGTMVALGATTKGQTQPSPMFPYKAGVVFSPAGTDKPFFETTSWIHMTTPVLFVSGTDDALNPNYDITHRWEAFLGLPQHTEAYFLFLEGANHFSFSEGLPGKPPLVEHQNAVKRVTIGFFEKVFEKKETLKRHFKKTAKAFAPNTLTIRP